MSFRIDRYNLQKYNKYTERYQSMKNDEILNMFYGDFIPRASYQGVIVIDGITYQLPFNTVISGKKKYMKNNELPTLIINNIKEFNQCLLSYLAKAIKVFDNDNFSYLMEKACGNQIKDQIKYILVVLFANAREDDFKNPISYLKMQEKFLKNMQLVNKYPTYTKVAFIEDLDSEIEVTSKRQEPNFETPYVFSSRLKYNRDGKNEYYELPNISYGITDNSVYVYTIKGSNRKSKEQSKYEKKINRLLYKINKNVNPDDEYLRYVNHGREGYYPENIIDVTHASVVALTIFLNMIQNEGFRNIIAVDFLPLRYISRTNSLLSRLKKKDKLDERSKLDIEKIQEYNQSNITEKFLRTFDRVNYHLNNLEVISYPNELDNSMHLRLNEDYKVDDNLINNIYHTMTNYRVRGSDDLHDNKVQTNQDRKKH